MAFPGLIFSFSPPRLGVLMSFLLFYLAALSFGVTVPQSIILSSRLAVNFWILTYFETYHLSQLLDAPRVISWSFVSILYAKQVVSSRLNVNKPPTTPLHRTPLSSAFAVLGCIFFAASDCFFISNETFTNTQSLTAFQIHSRCLQLLFGFKATLLVLHSCFFISNETFLTTQLWIASL